MVQSFMTKTCIDHVTKTCIDHVTNIRRAENQSGLTPQIEFIDQNLRFQIKFFGHMSIGDVHFYFILHSTAVRLLF